VSDLLTEKPAECLAPVDTLLDALAAERVVPAAIHVE
jgi:hypothetical protein